MKDLFKNNQFYNQELMQFISEEFPNLNAAQIKEKAQSCPYCNSKLYFSPGADDFFFCSSCCLSFESFMELLSLHKILEERGNIHASVS